MNVEIAERLAGRRKEAGFSQEALAEKLGVSRQAVSKWERSESSPDTDNLIALAKLYGVSLDDLLYVDGSIEDDVKFEAADRAAARRAEGATAQSTAPQTAFEKETSDQNSASQNPDMQDAMPTQKTDTEDNQVPPTPNSATNNSSATDEYFHIGASGIHVEDGKDSVHVSWRDGVHVNSKDGEEVHVGWDGIHVNDANYRSGQYDHRRPSSGSFRDDDGNTFTWNKHGVDINGEHFDSWREATQKYGHCGFVNNMSRKTNWHKFPFFLLAIVAYLIIGFSTDEWGYGLFVFFTVPVYHMIGQSISERRIVPFLAGIYPLAVTVGFLWAGFFYGLWHPAWIAFLTIPIWEWVVHALSRAALRRRAKKNEPIEVEPEL